MCKALNCIFVLLLFVPLLGFFFSPQKAISQSEKRKLAAFPTLDLYSFSMTDFADQFESYWNDHFGFREELISLHSTIYSGIFNKSPVKSVIKGKDGWLYFNLPYVVSDFLGMNHPTENVLQGWTTTLENRAEWLAENGIHYLLLPVPSKMHIYPEFLPPRYTFFQGSKEYTTLDLFSVFLERHSDFTGFVHLTPLFLNEKINSQLYYKTDTHWTSQGAYLAYYSLMKTINRWYPTLHAIPHTALRETGTIRVGDLANMLGIKPVPREKGLSLSPRKSCWDGKLYELPGHNVSETKRVPMVSYCPGAELTAVVAHDSFGPELIPFISQHFKRVTYVSMRDFYWLKDFLLKEKPDIFIHQQAARRIEGMLSNTWELTDQFEQE